MLTNKKRKRLRHKDRHSSIPRVSEAKWQHHERKTQQEQKEFLEGYSKHFKDVRASSQTLNVRRGDHIFYQGSSGGFYYQHLLCTGVDEDGNISVIEYSGNGLGVSSPSRSAAKSNAFAFVKVKEAVLTHQELEDKKAKIRKWPKGLQRFSVKKVIERAFSRIDERDYHAFHNNCEHFVTCGLNTSLQVKPWYQPVWDTVKGAGTATIQGIQTHGVSKGLPALLKIAGNFSDELLGTISSALTPAGFAIGGVIETDFAAKYIHNDYKRMKQGKLSKQQFTMNTVGTCSRAVGHTVGSIAGSVLGSAFGPLGSAVGGAIGYGIGHVAESAVGWCCEQVPKIKKVVQDYVIAPVKKVAKAVKTVCSTAWEGVKSVCRNIKSFFSSIFSW